MLLSKINRKWNNSYGKTHNEDLDKWEYISET